MEDAPQRIIYTSIYSTTQEEEESRGKIVVIILSAWFVAVIICCAYELYRNNKQYKKRKEIETDTNILWSKEQAAKRQEPSSITAFLQVSK